MSLVVAIVRPGRPSHGERRRADTWVRLAEAIGAKTQHYSVLGRWPRPTPASLRLLAEGHIVPEGLWWDGSGLYRQLLAAKPDVVIVQTARASHPAIIGGPWLTVVDLVDLLSRSYQQRATVADPLRRRGLNMLAAAHRRFEDYIVGAGLPLVLAGRFEAERIGADWLPIVIDAGPAPPPQPADPPFDAVFFGSLSYAPNIEALQHLASAMGAATDLRFLVAGHRPAPTVRALCNANGWTLVEDYPSSRWLASQAAVAIAPLRSTAGIQIKVLEGATLGLAQVVMAPALAGIGPDLPCVVVDGPGELVDAVRRLRDDAATRRALGADARRHIVEHFSVDAWIPAFRELVEPALDADRVG